MRIRKNANLSSLIFSHASGSERLQTHVCQLNQSPWDVIPFSQEPYPSSFHQYEGEDSFNGNGSLGDSIGAVESSVASLMEDAEEKSVVKMRVDNMVLDDNYNNYDMELIGEKKRVLDDDEDNEFKLKKGEKIYCCNKSSDGDSKGCRHCKNEVKEGQSMCDYHLTLPKSYGNNNNRFFKKPEKGSSLGGGGRRGGRGKAAKKGSSSTSNPYEFYYYSGFGPLWGKRRGGDNKAGELGNNNSINISAITTSPPQNTTPSSTTYSPIHHEFVDEDDDDEEDSENGDSGKKRMRKPVKARSLKSLM